MLQEWQQESPSAAVQVADAGELARPALPARSSIRHCGGAGLHEYVSPQVSVAIAGTARWAEDRAWRSHRDQGFAAGFAERWITSGSAVLSQLRGAFLAIVLDRTRGEIVIAIDRMGIVPLSYAIAADGTFAFATSTTVLRALAAVRTRLSAQHLFHYVYFHMVPSPGTVFTDFHKLEPAHLLRVRNGRADAQRYWQPQFASSPPASVGEARERLLDVLRHGVQRCEPHAATGAFLSGGIDSSTVTGLLTRSQPAAPRVYSMGFAAAGYDEAHYARTSAQHFGAQLRQFYVQPEDITRELPLVAAAYDEPFGNSSAIPTLVCARAAHADGITHMLAGDGGDELFAGNTRYAKQRTFEFYQHLPRMLRERVVEPVVERGGAGLDRVWPLSKLASYVRQARIPMPERTESYNFLTRTGLAEVFEPDFLSLIDPRLPLELLRQRYADAPAATLLDRMLYLDWKFTLADNDLRKVGRMCALAGVEVQYPWLDDEVVEFSATLPAQWKMHGRELRHFAKQALSGFLPDEVIRKPKHGFGLPFGEWLKISPELQNNVYALLRDLKRRGIVQPRFLDTLIEQHRGGHAAYYGSMVWILAMLEAWLSAQRLDL